MAILGLRENRAPVGAKDDDDFVSESWMPSLKDDGNKTLAIQKAGKSRVGGLISTFNKLLAAGDRCGALEAVGKQIPSQSALLLSAKPRRKYSSRTHNTM